MPVFSSRTALVGAVLVPATAFAQTTERISVSSTGKQGQGASYGVYGISNDGNRVLFDSHSYDLVTNDKNGVSDLYLRDRAAGTTVLVDVSTAGKGTVTLSGNGVLSGDGNVVIFDSLDGGLVPGDTNRQWDVFVRDLVAGTTERVNVDASGAENADGAQSGALSDDGRYLLFSSGSLKLVPTKTSLYTDLFLRDRVNATLEQLTMGIGGAEPDGDSYARAISPDGRFVLCLTTATNLVSGDANGLVDAYVYDRQNATATRVSLDELGREAAFDCFPIDMTPDGRFASFYTLAPMVAGDTNGLVDVYVRDLVNGTIEAVSVDSNGGFGTSGIHDDAFGGGLSDDGRYVLFDSQRGLTPDDTNTWYDVFVRDRLLGTTSRASIASDGSGGDSTSLASNALSADGSVVAMVSFATNLVPHDTNADADVFAHTFDRTAASWNNYGSGLAGTNGIPGLAPSVNPQLNQRVDLAIANSAGVPTLAVLFAGTSKATLTTGWGADLLVLPQIVMPIALPAGGGTLSDRVPPDESLVGVSLFLQALELDTGAAQAVAFTPGLELVFGR